MKTVPLENYSSLHELSLIELMGGKAQWLRKPFYVQFSFNLHTPLTIDSQAYLVLHTRDATAPHPAANSCFSIENLKRWRLDISSYQSMEDYLKASIRWHRCNYAKSKKMFVNYGSETSYIEEDWSEYAERVYQLYANVAHHYRHWLYDLHFFQKIAKDPSYKLLCAWFKGEMIAVFVLQEELPTLHSICCGFDYQHSSASYAYSWMHYALFEQAIACHKYQNVDVGLSANEAKKTIGFQSIPARIDIYSKGVTQRVLKIISHFTTATITTDSKLKIKYRKKVIR